MNIIIKFIAQVFPAFISSALTYIATIKSSKNNFPLNNMNFSYNKIYYPIFTMIQNEKFITDTQINKIAKILNKHKKYADLFTLHLFKALQSAKNERLQNSEYNRFKNHIIDKNYSLRKLLGYPTSNFFHTYLYSPYQLQYLFRLCFYFIFVYILAIISSMVKNAAFKNYTIYLLLLILLLLFFDSIIQLVKFLYYKHSSK